MGRSSVLLPHRLENFSKSTDFLDSFTIGSFPPPFLFRAEFVVSSLVVLNSTSGFSELKRLFLEISRVESEFPAYLLQTPTVADLDSRSGDLELVVASSTGRVFAFDSKLTSLRAGFPVEVDSVVAPVVVHDLTANGRLELSE